MVTPSRSSSQAAALMRHPSPVLTNCRDFVPRPPYGEVVAQPRASYVQQDPGSRAYASAGLPGAEWWVTGSAGGASDSADVELDDVAALDAENDLWPAAFGATT